LDGEVAAMFNGDFLLDYMLKQTTDENFQLSLLGRSWKE